MQSKLVVGAFGSVLSGGSGYGPPYNHLRFWNRVEYPKHGDTQITVTQPDYADYLINKIILIDNAQWGLCMGNL